MSPTAVHVPSEVDAAPKANQLKSNGHHHPTTEKTLSSQQAMDLEDRFGAHNYHPLPVVFDRALGCSVWDPEGREYLDCLSAYSAVNQGHCHPRIVAALTRQASKLCLSSRAFHNSLLGRYEEKITRLFGYEKILPMNTGVEAVETALKISRKWAYEKKGVPKGKAIIISAAGNFHGRTLGVVSMSTDDEARGGFGPFLKGVGPQCPAASKGDERLVRYNRYGDLEAALEAHGKEAAAVLLEPIQGEAGVVVPDADYLPKVHALCKKHNVLLILDEVQTGFGRTGKLLCQEHSGVKADITTLGKALSGGVYPVSAVLADSWIMDVIRPGEHGSTYGGNPLACAVAMEALDVLVEEKMTERAEEMGRLFRSELEKLKDVGGGGWVTTVRGKGLLNAIVIDDTKSTRGRGAWQLCLLMKSKGLLAKPTHVNIIRLAPPLVITAEQVKWAVGVIRQSLEELDVVEEIPGETPKEKDHKQGLP